MTYLYLISNAIYSRLCNNISPYSDEEITAPQRRVAETVMFRVQSQGKMFMLVMMQMIQCLMGTA
jgi:hypothetical protein